MNDIDIVVLWVDGSDNQWLEEKAKYQYLVTGEKLDVGVNRYRDWGIMRYWFRSIEKFAPWVRKIHFVTCGQKPEWLNINHQKLNCVNHSDYIPNEYLPLFNSSAIEIGIHKIKDLSEKFIFFNDDCFLLDFVNPSLFFKNNLPVYYAALHPIVPQGIQANAIMTHIIANSVTLVNKYFDCKKQFKINWNKWFLPHKVGIKTALLNFLYSRHAAFIGFGNAHLPVPILKSTMEELWQKEFSILDGTQKNKFRSANDFTQYLYRYWDLARGNFYPISISKLGKVYNLSTNSPIFNAIKSQSHKMICFHDADVSDSEVVFNQIKELLINAFEQILPEKSMFEK